MAQSDKKPKLTSVVSESIPHLKRGAMRDFLNIMQQHGYYNDSAWNRTDYIYTFENGSQIEFFGADSPDKVRGPRRDRLYINEANNVPYMAFDQLEVRTRDTIWLDWNPTNEFWFYTDVLEQRKDDINHITITYKDNEALEPSVVSSIEARKTNKSWWTVYGEGKLGEVEGKIYKEWQIIEDIPHEARLVRYGLDFGYTNDPTAVVAIYYYNGGYILDEILYQTGMLNSAIADVLKNVPQALTKADSAEPKSIEEIRQRGIQILPCTKGPDSIRNGIQVVQGQRISVTARSANIIREYRNFMWKTDRDGKYLSPPVAESGFDHTMDAIRYGFEELIAEPRKPVRVVRSAGNKYTGYGGKRIVGSSSFFNS
jgi:phage terminase large subunit